MTTSTLRIRTVLAPAADGTLRHGLRGRIKRNAGTKSALLGGLVLILASLVNVKSTEAAVFDVAADFSATSNPTGAWTYGYSTTLGGPLITYTIAQNASGIDFWSNNSIPFNPPVLGHNATGSPIVPGSFIVAPGQAMFHPGLNNEYSIYRFTAPTAGRYQLMSAYEGIDFIGTTTDVHVLHNNNAIFNGLVNGFGSGSGTAYNASLVLAAGDTVDFAVGFGSNGTFQFDSTAIQAKLVVPEPGTTTLAWILAGMGSLTMRRRVGSRRSCDCGV
jgi:hypothetical protein